MGDNKLVELYAQRNSLDTQILARKREIAKEKGDVVDSIDDLVCDKHPNSVFEEVKQSTIAHSNPPKIYKCKECKDDEVSIISLTKAYECPNCGIVKGNFDRVPYRSPKESWRSLAGREGEHYHCTVCDTQIGSHYWKIS